MSTSALAVLKTLCSREGVKGRRKLTTVLSEFADGYSDGWCFDVSKAFRPALAITYEEVKENGRSRMQWKQGASFNFSRGDTLYDTKAAYKDRANANVCVQVKSATGVKLPGGDEPRDSGTVIFDLLVQDENRRRFVSKGLETTTQDEFVRFLIAGPPAEWSSVSEIFSDLGLETDRA